MPNSMAQMIQLIATLSELQSRKRALDLEQDKIEMSKRQFAQQMGFNEKDQRYREIGKMFDTYIGATAESKKSAGGMAKALGFDEGTTAAFLQLIGGAPTSMQTQKEAATQQGYTSMAPDQQQTLNRETANTNLSGMNQGQMGTSGLVNQLAGLASQNLQTDSMAAKQAALGFTPGWAAWQQADASRGQVAANYYGTNAQMIADAQKQAAQLASFKATGALTPDQQLEGYSRMLEVAKNMKSKGSSDASVLTDLALWNRFAGILDPTLVRTSPGSMPSEQELADRLKNLFSGGPRQPTSPGMGQTGPMAGRPQFNYMNPGAQPQPQNPMAPYNPLSPFIR